ncbi:UNKNOWN [Stylonychia lemnae]|uniref:Uncharacterized protein n=1 Tax=Stylonychia lemnae TaxID=5949 RepID=A0A078AAM5_STYLE|nr:UNKNOWN [Stylonychia lemnae]|eukprot:CDW77848.1 UNKNOWN [Stylonychia lemnae]
MQSKKQKVPNSVLFDILTYLDYKDLFCKGMNTLCKSISYSEYFTEYIYSTMVMRKLGIIEDIQFEIDYYRSVMDIKEQISIDQVQLNYRRREKQVYLDYFRNYPRKKSKIQYLFGYQSIGGLEEQSFEHPEDRIGGIIHLFVDSDEVYCSSDKCDPCITSGIFFEEPKVDFDEWEYFIQVFDRINEISKAIGYKVLDQNDNENQEQHNQRLLNMARRCNFIDFRLKRRLIDGIKENIITNSRFALPLAALIRELIFKSTKNLPTKNAQELIQLDIKFHKILSANQLYSFHRMYIVNKGPFTCPARSFFVFTHNQDNIDLKNHPLVQYLKDVKTKDQLIQKLVNSKADQAMIKTLLPNHFEITGRQYDLVEFGHSFYYDKFQEKQAVDSLRELDDYRLRLCAFADLKECQKQWIPFSQFFSGRYVSVMFTDRVINEDTDEYLNYDVQTIYFDGLIIPSLLNFQL